MDNKEIEIDFKFFPWEKGEKPYFINPEGFEWYVDKDTLKYLKRKDRNDISIDDLYSFFVKKDDDITRVLINGNQEVIYENKSYEAVLAFIDTIKLKMSFDKFDNETIRKRKES